MIKDALEKCTDGGGGHMAVALATNTGYILEKSGDIQGAIGYYEMAARYDNELQQREDPLILLGLGRLRLQAGNHEQGRADLQRCRLLAEERKSQTILAILEKIGA